jgi:threonine-phosphate decarboxylase
MVPLLKKYRHLLILNAFTKLYAMAGLRLGYMLCADAALVKRIAAFGPQWNVSVPAQKAGFAALGVSGWPETTRALVETERRFMEKQLTALGLTVFPGEGNFLLVKCETPLYDPLANMGILVRSCANFSGLHDRFIRIGLKKRKQNAALIAAIAEVLHG